MRRTGLLAAAIATVGLAAAAPAGAVVTVGPASPAATGLSNGIFNALEINRAIPLAVPFDGVVVRWRIATQTGTDVRLRAVRLAPGGLAPVASAPWQTATAGAVVTLDVNLPVRAGELLGVESGASTKIAVASGGDYSELAPPPADGAAPAGAAGWINTLQMNADIEPDNDHDGVADESDDPDDDNDGVADGSDNCPLVANAGQENADADPAGNACATDDDGDSHADSADAFPLDATEWADADRDGTGDNADTDDDNDGLTDAAEATAGTSPTDADSDDDGLPDGTEVRLGTNPLVADSDGDGTGDGADRCPLAAGAAPGCPALADQFPQVRATAPAQAARISTSAATRLTAEASDDRGIARVEFIDDEVVECVDDTAPYECSYRPEGRDVGVNVVVVRAVDTAGQQSTQVLALSVPRFAPGGLSIATTRRAAGGGIRVTTTGRLSLPTAVTTAQGCRGTVIVTVRAGRVSLSSKATRLDARCRYRSAATLFDLPTGDLRVVARFGGNAILAPLSSRPRQLPQ